MSERSHTLRFFDKDTKNKLGKLCEKFGVNMTVTVDDSDADVCVIAPMKDTDWRKFLGIWSDITMERIT